MKSERTRGTRRWQRGFTLISTSITLAISGICIAGAWIAASDMHTQVKVAGADRQMDQYAHATMQELTNLLSWSWGGLQVQGGPRNTRWKFYVDDIVEENGQFTMWESRNYQTDNAHFLVLTFAPNQGILVNGRPPKWAVDRRGQHWYQWTGRRPAHLKTAFIDQRDRMTMESLLIDFNPFARYPVTDAVSREKRKGVVEIKMTMHYRYAGGNWNHLATRMYGDSYVREREFQTQVAMRNYDVTGNPFREAQIQAIGG